MDREETERKAEALAGEVLTLSRNTLLVNLRFLDAALSRLTPTPRPGDALSTDGRKMYYDPRRLLRRYQEDRAAPVRDYLHLALHCVYRHLYALAPADIALWNLSCDIAVEHAIFELGLPAAAAGRELRQKKVFAALRAETDAMTAEKICRRYQADPPSPAEIAELRSIFLADDHSLWYTGGVEKAEESAWLEVSRRMQVDMETFARRQGDRAGALMQNLKAANRDVYDYAAFLQKFAARGDGMKLDPEEFDYIFYTYGMRLYRKMPLVEPLEYRESAGVRDFVVAVTVSGNFPPALTAAFLQKTFDVLKGAETYRSGVRLHLLPPNGAGAPVAVSRREELDAFLADLPAPAGEVRDFRPAFLETDALIRNRAFRSFKGFLCLTDGPGIFPASMPRYPAAFVFATGGYDVPDVPPWAIRLALQKDEIADFGKA